MAGSPLVRHFVFGASVTRLAASTVVAHDSLRYHIPYVVVDGLDNATRGGTAYSIDGRGLTVPPAQGGLTIWQGFLDQITRASGTGLRPDDWVIIDWTLGTEALAVAEPVIDAIVARCIRDGYRLAWTIPRVAYGAMTDTQLAWNDAARKAIQERVPSVPVHALIDWRTLVQSWTVIGGGSLSAAQKAVGQPLLYDGRHPTGAGSTTAGRGCERFATAVAAAVGY